MCFQKWWWWRGVDRSQPGMVTLFTSLRRLPVRGRPQNIFEYASSYRHQVWLHNKKILWSDWINRKIRKLYHMYKNNLMNNEGLLWLKKPNVDEALFFLNMKIKVKISRCLKFSVNWFWCPGSWWQMQASKLHLHILTRVFILTR